MTLNPRARSRIAAIGLVAALGLPAYAVAAPPSGGTPGPAGGTPIDPVGAQGGPGTLAMPGGMVLVRQPTILRGQLTVADSGRNVLVQLLGPDGGWVTVARTRADRGGSFAAPWRATHIGRFRMRAVAADRASASALGGTTTTIVDVLRPVKATFFGPGMYGSRTACGQRLTPDLQGVAHRTLPCGTLVHVAYRGHNLTVPVVDRGPFTAGVSYDLTAATAQGLGMDGTARIGALALRG